MFRAHGTGTIHSLQPNQLNHKAGTAGCGMVCEQAETHASYQIARLQVAVIKAARKTRIL